MLSAAWRVSKLSIVAAIREVAETPPRATGARSGLVGAAAAAAGVAVLALGLRRGDAYLFGIGGNALANGAIGSGATRTTGDNVGAYMQLGYQTVSDSPFGVCGPKGMDAGLTRTLHDAFKRTLDDPNVQASFDKYDQTVIYMNTETYTKFARDSYIAEKATIERLGLANKG